MITFSSHVDGYYDVGDQMVHKIRLYAERLFTRQLQEKKAITSVDQFEMRRKKVRSHFLEAIGGLPDTRTPLSPRCTGVIDRADHTIEKIIYESLPGFFVTAVLYVPKGLTEPAPAVVFVHGHSDAGKSYAVYQAVCIDLVANGFVVFAIDPPGQGERKQYYDPEKGEVVIEHCTAEHTFAGLQFVVSGANLARHFIWDTTRGVDYLSTRAEVDPDRIGVTGNSGGGTQTSYLMLMEPRFAAAVPCTFPMTLESYMKSGQSQDSEQIIRGCFEDGPDHDDYITGMAPKPVLVGAAAYDFFPIEGTLEAVERAKRIYGLYGAEDKVDVVISPARHGYYPRLREAAVNWFKVHLKGENPDFETGDPQSLPEEALWCTPRGRVLDMFPQSRRVFDLNREWLGQHEFKRRPLISDADFTSHVEGMRDAIAEVLDIDCSLRSRPIYPRIIWEDRSEGYRCEKTFFFSEPDIVVTGVMMHPHGEALQTDIVLFEHGTADIPGQSERLESLLEANHRVFVFDVRGIGAVQVRPVNRTQEPHRTEYKLGCDAMMMKRSTLGMRVFDVLRCYDYLRTRRDVQKIGIIGVDSGAFFAYFATALEEGIADATFENLLFSYRDLVSTTYYNSELYSLKVAAWGILRRFDIVDLIPCLVPRDCKFITPRDAKGQSLTEQEFEEKFQRMAHRNGYMPNGWRPHITPGRMIT
jgi:dienelactone hydrolase